MNSDVCFILSILYEGYIVKVAFKVDINVLGDAADYYMEESSRKVFSSLLPEHIREMGPIVHVEEIADTCEAVYKGVSV